MKKNKNDNKKLHPQEKCFVIGVRLYLLLNWWSIICFYGKYFEWMLNILEYAKFLVYCFVLNVSRCVNSYILISPDTVSSIKVPFLFYFFVWYSALPTQQKEGSAFMSSLQVTFIAERFLAIEITVKCSNDITKLVIKYL